ncbi:hypothetical protein PTTG_30602, partial [Puccinia triticina 1-1 BBBD Race 1]
TLSPTLLPVEWQNTAKLNNAHPQPLVELARHAQRWDLARHLPRHRTLDHQPPILPPLGPAHTALLDFLRHHHPPSEPILDPDPQRWSIHVICQSIESKISSAPHHSQHQWRQPTQLGLPGPHRLHAHRTRSPAEAPTPKNNTTNLPLPWSQTPPAGEHKSTLQKRAEHFKQLPSKLARVTIPLTPSSQPWTTCSAP